MSPYPTFVKDVEYFCAHGLVNRIRPSLFIAEECSQQGSELVDIQRQIPEIKERVIHTEFNPCVKIQTFLFQFSYKLIFPLTCR